MQYLKNRVLKIKNSPLEFEKDFKPINISIDNMDKFEGKKIKKKRRFAKTLGTIGMID